MLSFLFFLLLLSFSQPLEDKTIKKINNLNLLFPLINDDIDSRSIEFPLIAYNGCYEWQSSRPEYLQIRPPSLAIDTCHSQAIVALSSNKPYDNIIWITAKDKDSGDVFKVESKISKIHKIEILTKLRTIDVGDVQVLEVLGYDPDENVFSTLEGLRFHWKIEQKDNILEFLPTKDSFIKSTEIRKKMENQHFQSDIILVRGLRTGYVKVHISLNEKGYEHVTDVVSLIIIERFMIWPENNIYILPKTTVNFELAIIRNDNHLMSLEKIVLPNNNYNWKNDVVTFGIIKNTGVFIANDQAGITEVIVNDIRISNNSAHSSIHVVEPWYMDLEICEFDNNDNFWENHGINLNYYKPVKTITFDNNWNLIKGKIYYVRAVVYDQFKNKLHITKDAKITFNFNTALFSILDHRNHEILIKPLTKIEKTSFSSKLVEVSIVSQPTKKYIPTRTIEIEKSLSIITQISLFTLSKMIVLPYISSLAKNQQNYFIKGIGGSGFYEFLSQSNKILTIDTNGMISPKSLGTTILEVHDRKNWKNLDKIEVKISAINRIKFPESIKESFTNSNANLDIMAFSEDQFPFSNCSSLNFVVKTREINPLFEFSQTNYSYDELLQTIHSDLANIFFKENLEQHQQNQSKYTDYLHHVLDEDITDGQLNNLFNYYRNFGVCNRAMLQIKNDTGDQMIHVVSEADVAINSDDLRLLIYNRFTLINPVFKAAHHQKNKYEVILSYGSSLLWSFQGGPNQMEEKRTLQEKSSILKESSYLITNELAMEKASISPSMKNRKNFLITCSKFHDFDEKFIVNFNAWNEQDHRLISPVNASISVIVSCKIPKSFLIFLLREDQPIYDFNSAKLQSFPNIYVKNLDTYDFQVIAFDVLNNAFYNFSSLDVKWTMTKHKDAVFENSTSFDISSDICVSSLDEFSHIRIFTYTGDLLIQVHSSSYNSASLSFHEVSDDLLLTVGYNIESESTRYTLYYHPDNSLEVNLFFGSGSFKLHPNDTSLAHIITNQSDSFRVMPKALGTLKIEIYDEKMVKSRISTCFIFIVQINKAKIDLSPAILQESDYTKVEISLYDSYDNLIPISQMNLINFSLDVLSFTEINQRDLFKISKSTNSNQFLAQGLKSGSYRFIVYFENFVKNDTKMLLKPISNEAEVYVYDKLNTIPNNLLLAPGCNCHMEVIGGPSEKAKITSNIELRTRVSQENMIKLTKQEQNLFLVEGQGVGNGRIFFELVQKESNIILSVYEVNLRIELVNHIEILGFPERRVYFGATFRLLALMKFNNMMFTASICPFEFFWTSQNRQILDISVPNIENFLANPKLANYDKKVLENFHIGINATAIGIGLAEINLLVKFNYPNPFQKQEKNLIEKIRILDYLTSATPSFIRKPENINSLLILPPKTEFQLKFNKDLEKHKIKMGCEDTGSIEVTMNGLIKTGEKRGKSTIIIAEEDSTQSLEDETIYVNVLTTNIFSIFIENSYKLLKMPIEATSDLKIHYLDYYGRLFPSNIRNIKIQVHLSNTKIIDLRLNEDNSILSIRGKMIGATLCTLSLETNPYVFDMFLIIVDSIITPASPVYVHEGGHVQFNVLHKNGNKEKWFTNDNSIIELNQITGKAIALREGTAMVLYKETIQYTTKINVFRVNKWILDNKAPIVVTNIVSSKYYKEEYKILVRAFSDDYEIEEIFNEKGPINNNLKFFCETLQEDWIFVKHEIHLDSAEKKHQLFCVVVLKKTYPNDVKVPNSMTLLVNLASNRENSFHFQWKFDFEIYWAFKIPETSKKINLNKKYNAISLNIMTPYDLDIRTTNDLIAKSLKTKYTPEKNDFLLNITVPPNYRMIEGFIYLHNLLTNQTESIVLIYDPSSEVEVSKKAIGTIQESYTFKDFMLIIICVVCLFLGWGVCNQTRADNQNPAGKFDMRRMDQRKYDESIGRRIGANLNAYEGNRIMSSPQDVLKTPLDKRKSMQEGGIEGFSNREDQNFSRHLIS